MKIVTRTLGGLFLILTFGFVLLPVFLIVVISLNKAASFPARFEGLTLEWYFAIARYPEFTNAAVTSAMVALVASLVAVSVAFLGGYVLARKRVRAPEAVETLLTSPLLVPQIVMSLAMLQFAGMLGIGSGWLGLIAVHAVYVMPFALRLVLTGLVRFDFALEEASASLGASRWATWSNVTLPLLKPNLLAGCTFCFILSFVNLPLSLFLTTPRTATLPIVMFAYMESRIDPMVAAVASLAIIAAALVTLLLEQVLRIRLVD